MDKYQEIFEKLWNDYRAINPSVDKIHNLLHDRGEQIINDHIAFRTFDIPGIDIETLALPFKKTGYVEKDSYFFEEKRLNAKHYEHKNPLAPKIFISELRTKDLSPLVSETANWIVKQIKKNKIPEDDLLFSGRCWNPINIVSYEALRKESEYAAWMYAFGFRANHFTIFVNHLKSIKSLEEMNIFLKEHAFVLNSSGGEIKGSKELLLKQSSTLADEVQIKFEEGEHFIPCCYYEFAERFPDKNNELFSGFIAKSADKIFESTDRK